MELSWLIPIIPSVIAALGAAWIASRGFRKDQNIAHVQQEANEDTYSIALIRSIQDGYQVSFERTERQLVSCLERTSVLEGRIAEITRQWDADKAKWETERQMLRDEIYTLKRGAGN